MRQAVVVIHGMGEQRPTETLNRIASALIPDPRLIERPDDITDGFDARRLVAPQSSTQGVLTELYEYHWSHLMSGNTLSHLWPLVRQVMFRWPGRLRRLTAFWVVLWLTVVAVVFAVWRLRGSISNLDVPSVLSALGLGGIGLVVAAQAVKWMARLLSQTFVDVARYLDARPQNQKVRDDIRKGAFELLRGLHISGRYDRIVVVGHSLGSLIAYDVINYMWARMNRSPEVRGELAQDNLAALERAGVAVKSGTVGVSEYLSAQRQLWVEQRLNGSPWLISDLITVGSPLAHADVLIARGFQDLADRQTRFGMTTSPPTPDSSSVRWSSEETYSFQSPYGGRILGATAPFAVTRWHALWFKADLFAGPLHPLFGPGIHDVMAVSHHFWTSIPVIAHGKYFSYVDDLRPDGAISSLREMVDLDARSWLEQTENAPRSTFDQRQDEKG
jgi:hypothetical protein